MCYKTGFMAKIDTIETKLIAIFDLLEGTERIRKKKAWEIRSNINQTAIFKK